MSAPPAGPTPNAVESPLTAIAASARQTAETLLVGASGGIGFYLIGFPAGFVSGSMSAVALAALLGRPMGMPMWLSRTFFVAIGVALGAVVTPKTLQGMETWPLSIAVLMLSTLCITTTSYHYLRRVHHWDKLSCLLAASPGALAQAMTLAVDYKADIGAIVIVQSVRVLFLAVGLPLALSLFGFEAEPVVRGAAASLSTADMSSIAIIFAVSIATALILHRFRFPGGLIFGAMMGSAVLHGSGLIHVNLPAWYAYASMIGTGSVAGARFTNVSLRMLLHYLGVAAGSFLIAITVTCLFLTGLLQLVSIRVADLVIAYSPGAQDTMMILALALHLDPVFVGAHHLARFMLVSMMIPLMTKVLARPEQEPAEPPVRKPSPVITPDD